MLEYSVPKQEDESLRPYLIVSRDDRQTKGGQPYLMLTLRGLDLVEFDGKAWSSEVHLFEILLAGQVVELAGPVEPYNGRKSLIVRRAQPSVVSPDQFVRRTHLDVDALWAGLHARVEAMSEPLTRFVSQRIMARPGFEAAFKRAPAASRMHNNWVGGLIEHVHSLCALADGVVTHYRQIYDLPVSHDKVIFGLIFHDAGKINEYDINSPTFEATALGRFAPHIVLGPAWVYHEALVYPEKNMPNFAIELAHLMHLLASHHGTLEWGSPVKPASLEAVILHHLDNLDAKVLHAKEYVAGKPGPTDCFSAYSRAEGTCYFQPTNAEAMLAPSLASSSGEA